MSQQKTTNNVIVGLIILILIIVGAAFYFILNSNTSPATGPGTTVATSTVVTIGTSTNSPLQTISSSTTGVTYRYPATLNTSYIQIVDWPPTVTVSSNAYTCTSATSSSSPTFQTVSTTINGTQYCITTNSEGAAGSVYKTYTYTFPKDQKAMTLTFTLRYPQCENYPSPELNACSNEESSLNVNTVANNIAQSITYTPVVSPAQPITPPSVPVTLNSLSPVSGPRGTLVTLVGTGFLTENKVLFDQDVAIPNAPFITTSNGMESITFSVPAGIGPDCKANEMCPEYERVVTPATYTVTVENSNGVSNALSFLVTQ